MSMQDFLTSDIVIDGYRILEIAHYHESMSESEMSSLNSIMLKMLSQLLHLPMWAK